MVDFAYQEMFPLKDDPTEYRLLAADHISPVEVDGTRLLRVAPEGLTLLAEQAFRDVSHFLRASHLKQLAAIFDDPESSANDKAVALELLKNAVIAAEGEFPMCQDTGTAIVIGKKGQGVWTGYSDEEALSKGIFNAYTRGNLRYSQNAPLTMYEEKNTGCNLPAQVEIYATGGDAYKFLFIAKGGGSANKTYLYQETKATLTPEKLVDFLSAKMKSLGTAACPPYHLAFVIGGTSAETNLKIVKLASTGYLDHLEAWLVELFAGVEGAGREIDVVEVVYEPQVERIRTPMKIGRVRHNVPARRLETCHRSRQMKSGSHQQPRLVLLRGNQLGDVGRTAAGVGRQTVEHDPPGVYSHAKNPLTCDIGFARSAVYECGFGIGMGEPDECGQTVAHRIDLQFSGGFALLDQFRAAEQHDAADAAGNVRQRVARLERPHQQPRRRQQAENHNQQYGQAAAKPADARRPQHDAKQRRQQNQVAGFDEKPDQVVRCHPA